MRVMPTILLVLATLGAARAAETVAPAQKPAAQPASLLALSEPPDGARLKTNPHWVRLHFRTDIFLRKLEVHDQDGRPWKLSWGGKEDTSADLEAMLPDYLPKGTYTVVWEAADANGQTEDKSPLEWGKPLPPQSGKVRFSIE